MTKPGTGASRTIGESLAYEEGRASAQEEVAALEAQLAEAKASLVTSIRELGKYATDAGYYKGKAEGLEILLADLKASLNIKTRKGKL